MHITIAIDGPSGAGKSTVSHEVAQKLNILHLDTGAMYRAVALYCHQAGIDAADEAAVAAALQGGACRLDIVYRDGCQATLLNGRDVSGDIRQEHIGILASKVSCHAGVRRHLVSLQQDLAARTDMVMDGRDIGTVVLKNAPLKVFLTASLEARAERRMKELAQKGVAGDYAQVYRDLAARDEQDMNRQTDPLRRAEDAVVVDSSALTQRQTVEQILRLVDKVYGKQA